MAKQEQPYDVLKWDWHHYIVHKESIKALRCKTCAFVISPRNYRKVGDRSGLGRYNRARAAMLRHVRDQHK